MASQPISEPHVQLLTSPEKVIQQIVSFETTVEPPIKDPLRKGQPPYKGHTSRSLYRSIMFLTSEKRTTSEIRTEAVSQSVLYSEVPL